MYAKRIDSNSGYVRLTKPTKRPPQPPAWFVYWCENEFRPEIADLKTRVGNLEVKVDNIDKRLSNLEARMDKLEVKVDNIVKLNNLRT
jgi:hypothetical protein